MVKYPEGLPLPLREGYEFTPVSPTVRTPLASGRSMQRRKFRSVPTEASVSWIMSGPQASFFEAWFDEEINSGADWFECPLRTPLGLDYYKVQFKDIYKGPELIGVKHWRFSAVLILFKRPVLPTGWVANAPSYILNPEIFDISVNKEWPKS